MEAPFFDFGTMVFLCLSFLCVYYFVWNTLFGILYWITNEFYQYRIVQSGLIVPIWLFLSGIFIRKIYYFMGHKLSLYFWTDSAFDEKCMSVYWIMIPIISAIVILIDNFNLVLMIIAIIIGKFLWIDTSIDVRKIKAWAKTFKSENKNSLEIIFMFAIRAIGGGFSFALYKVFFHNGFVDVLFFVSHNLIMCIIISQIIDRLFLKYYFRRQKRRDSGKISC